MQLFISQTRSGQVVISGLATLFVLALWYVIPHPAVAIIGFLPVLLVSSFRIPFILCLLFIVFSFFRIHEAFPFLYPFKIPKILSITTVIVITWCLLTKQVEVYWQRQFTYLTIFVILTAIGIGVATDRGVAIGAFQGTYIKIYLMVLLIAWLTRTPAEFSLAARFFLIAGISVSVVAIFNKLNKIGLVEGTRVTISREMGSMLGDPNDLSLVLLFPASFALSLLLTKETQKTNRILAGIAIIVIIWAILATQSRGGLLGIMAVFGIVGWFRTANKTIFIVVGVVAALVLPVAAGISDRKSGGAAEGDGVDASSMGRIYAWRAATGMALAYPVTGVGIANFYYNYFDYSPHWDGKPHSVHSTWFGVLAETGVVGFAVFMMLVVCIVRKALGLAKLLQKPARDGTFYPQLRGFSLALFSGIISFIISGSFLTQGFTWNFYILIALITALEQFTKDYEAPPEGRDVREKISPFKPFELTRMERSHNRWACIWRRRYMVVIPIIMLTVGSLYIEKRAPQVYEGKTSILVQELSKLNPYLERFTVSTDVESRFDALKRLVKSRSLLSKAALELGWIDENSSEKEINRAMYKIKEGLRIRLTGMTVKAARGRGTDKFDTGVWQGEGLLWIFYETKKPEDIVPVLSAVRIHLVDILLSPAKEAVEHSAEFIDQELVRRRKELDESTRAVEEFKTKHADILPELYLRNRGLLMSAKNGLRAAEEKLARNSTRLEHALGRLMSINPIINGIDRKVTKLETEKAEMRARYTDQHSKIVSLDTTIEGLLEQRKELVKALARIEQTGPTRALKLAKILSATLESNAMPTLLSQIRSYQEYELAVETAQSEVNMWKKLVTDHEDRINRYGEMEQTLTSLERDYQTRLDLYNKLMRRQHNAEITVALSSYNQGDIVRFIDDPERPRESLTPPWYWFLLAGVIGGIALGLGLTYAAEVNDPHIRKRDYIEEMLNVPMVARMPQLAGNQSNYGEDLSSEATYADYVGRWLSTTARVSIRTVITALQFIKFTFLLKFRK